MNLLLAKLLMLLVFAQPDMTLEEAQAAAIERWGPEGTAYYDPQINRYCVGMYESHPVPEGVSVTMTITCEVSYRGAFGYADTMIAWPAK